MADRILIVEDETSLRETIAYTLKREEFEVLGVGDGAAALQAARNFRPDLMLLDVMLPIMDGFEVVRILRREMSVPILMLTARDSEIDRVLGLEIGADDYITKPFAMRELVARIKATLRRVQYERQIRKQEKTLPESGVLNSNNLQINLVKGQVFLNQMPIALKPQAFDLLAFLVQNSGRVFSRKALLDRVWGWDYSGGMRTVDVHIRWLREKIERDPGNPERIITVRGKGYRFDG